MGFNYTLTEPDLMPFYRRAIKQGLRVLKYNGDADPGINVFVSENWTSALGFDELQPWRPWTTDGKRRMGGYVTRYVGGFDFLTIRGSGHMVPQFKPREAFALFSFFLNREAYPRYNGSSLHPPHLSRAASY